MGYAPCPQCRFACLSDADADADADARTEEPEKCRALSVRSRLYCIIAAFSYSIQINNNLFSTFICIMHPSRYPACIDSK
jgi:hypothetical protein